MELIYTDQAMSKQGVLRDFALDMAFGDSENDFQLTMPTPQSKRMGIDRDAVIETRSGTGSIEIQDANGSILQGLSVDGKSEQVRYSGKNLASPIASTSARGISMATAADGTVTFSGTASSTGNSNVTNWVDVPAGKYTLSIIGKTGTIPTIRARITYDSGSTSTNTTVGSTNKLTFDVTKAGKVAVGLYPTSGNAYSGMAKFQIEAGSDATEYEPYVGGIPSPNPDYPQPVQVVEGRNIFSGVAKDGYYNDSGVWTASTTTGTSDTISVIKGETYTISGTRNGTGTYRRVHAINDDGTWNAMVGYVSASSDGRWTKSFTATTNKVVVCVIKADTDVQLERGSVATPYVSHGALELVVRGKNLLKSISGGSKQGLTATSNADRSITLNGKATGTGGFDSDVFSLAAGTYTISGCPSGGGSGKYMVIVTDSATSTNIALDSGDGAHFTVSKQTSVYVRVGYWYGWTYSDLKFYPQLESGNQKTPYEPYSETRTTLYLQGHRLASLPDGTKDELTVDKTGNVLLVERVGSVDMGTLNWNYQSSHSRFAQAGTLPDVKSSASRNVNIFCTKYAPSASGSDFTIFHYVSQLYVYDSKAGTNTSAFKASMSGVMLYYELATPQAYDLGRIDLPHTLNGYTRITMDAAIDAPFSVEYEAAPASKSYTVEVIPHLQSGALVYSFGTDIGGIVDSEVFDSTGDIPVMAYSGRTWHGILDASITRPNSGQGYLTLTGDINAAIGTLISRAGLGSVFEAGQDAGVSVSYQVPRYISVWEALRRLCKSYGMRPSIHRDNGKTIIEAVSKQDYSNGSVSELSMPLSFGRDYRPVNHLVVLGQGELAARTVIDLYADSAGNVSTTQTLFGADEVAEVYENTNEADAAKLRDDGIKKLQELQQFASVDMALPQDEQFQIGDTVTAYSTEVGLMAAAEVVKKVVTVGEDGFAITDYELGEPAIKAYR